LGFYYQSFFGLSTLVGYAEDSAAVAIERGDDVELKANNVTLFFQLKHSLSQKPPAVTIVSRALWRTLKVWIDLLPRLSLPETRFHLVTVGAITEGSPLAALLDISSCRKALALALEKEALRVLAERDAADEAGDTVLPHADRADGCSAFINLTSASRLNLLRRILIVQGSRTIDQMEREIAGKLSLIRGSDRLVVARSLIEWWDRQVVYALCEKRPRFIARSELLQEISERVSDLERDTLLPDFTTMSHPADYQPEGMLTRQIALVGGRDSDIARAIREEWRARQQRAKWVLERPGMAAKIGHHDIHMCEEWSDKHKQAAEDCAALEEDGKCKHGLALLRWSHEDAPKAVEPIAIGWSAPYYVRGSYQVLAINCEVGWHPDYLERLKDNDA
jgi:hypothetical protein